MNLNFNKCISALILLTAIASGWNCASETKPSSAEPPAKVTNGVKESELATVTLSPEAEQRLGIATVRVEHRKVARRLRLGGEIVAPPGRRIFVTAPMAGVVIAPVGALPQAGTQVRKGQTIFRLLPLPSERDLLGTPNELALKKMQFELAQAKAQRAKQLLRDDAGSVKAHEEAEAERAAAEAVYEAAEARLHLTQNIASDSARLAESTMVLATPFDGVLQDIKVAPRQTVSAGAPLFEVISQNPVWVRVPVYVGDLATIDTQQPAQVEPFGDNSASSRRAAAPVQGPPHGDAGSASADVFFEMTNPEGTFRTGQKVNVAIAQRDTGESYVVPWSAILYDIHGGTWVYMRTAPHVFARQRLELQRVVDSLAVFTRGPAAGAEIVVTGAAEIFGTEFGGGK